jgi:hypothetical protein
MKSYTTTQQLSFFAMLKLFGNAVKNFFQNGSNKDFERLKNFISS